MSASTSRLHELAIANLMGVFNERDSDLRLQAIQNTYADDITFYEHDRSFTGHQAVNDQAQKLLDENPAWTFKPEGMVSINHNVVMLGWGFGPKDEAFVHGKDVLITEGEKVSKIYTFVVGAGELAP